ncbi:DUF4296 domain-containing protein [Spirosoma fluviale]|uniref:DUF4296 domain-containing protein n=1 Tax=Spirosoma fluviale TaxID=1597977 RepID=A0A286GIY9_9BACT|nr:DUF4296 domain-containing protein [Spirosoma fluviale]SOD95442.1 protein of unknown function [Spirosoma fluviale]
MLRNQYQRHLWSVLLSGWLVAACTAPENKPPENLLTEEQMASILTEVHMAEAKISRINLRSIDSSNIVYKHLESAIFKKNGVDTATYRKSYIFYSSHPADMEAIYQRVTERLKKKVDAHTPKTS